jgi:CRISPR/Cas system CSM-associated protein Csm5 (group 7 of RAMP superfamily)
LDDWLLKNKASELGWGAKADWLYHLSELANARARERIAAEGEYAERSGWTLPAKAFDSLAAGKMQAGQFLLQMGWGTGWTGMTVGPLLPAPDQLKVREKYNLGRARRSRGDWRPKPGEPFPKSRRYPVARGDSQNPQPGVPFGWVCVTLRRKE